MTERVGRYQLLEPIGVGPCGTVSRAKVFGVAGFERQFAVKRFHAELTAAAPLAQALSSGARAYGGLEHPRIARMSEFGVAQGTTFTAVEYIAGLDALRLITEARLANTTLAAGGALALVSQAARAVGYAHGRGLTHLGLSPTNVVVNAEGDIKITDFGILSATLPTKPLEVPRLAQRIAYLAPEQLANEATSAATDVFALGVLAFELVTGQRAFKGETPQQIAQSVMAGPPSEPQLPRPIVRVLQRCLARSPFERFPDARALADALDAALRVAPVPGTRKDIGAQVKATLDRLAELHSGELSGVVALNLGTANLLRGPVAPVAALGKPIARESEMGISTTEFVRSEPPQRPTRTPADTDDVPTPAARVAMASASSTVPELPSLPMTTVTGLAPPPIPVPQGISVPPTPTPPASGLKPPTKLGIANPQRPVLGAVPPPRAVPPRIPPVAPPERPSETPVSPLRAIQSLPSANAPAVPLARPPAERRVGAPNSPEPESAEPARPSSDIFSISAAPVVNPGAVVPVDDDNAYGLELSDSPGDSLEISIERATEDRATLAGLGTSSDVHRRREHETDAMPQLLVDKLSSATTMPTTEIPHLVDEAFRASALEELPEEQHVGKVSLPEPDRDAIPTLVNASSRQYPVEPRPPPPTDQRALETMDVHPSRPRSRMPLIIGSAVAVIVLGAGFVVFMILKEGNDPVAETPRDADTLAATDGGKLANDATGSIALADGGVRTDGGVIVVNPGIDAGVTKPTSDSLSISSTPAGARVFIDGADAGVTPLKLPGTPDRHTIALLMPSHELYVAQVDGHGAFTIPLKAVTPTGGPAGIKVTKCKDKDRYYVFVDGKPTGQTCPTERIETDLGPHVVEVYDLVSETRKKWDINITDTRLSYRVRID